MIDVVIPNIAAEAEQVAEQMMAEQVISAHQGDLVFLKNAALNYNNIIETLKDQLALFSQILRRQSQIRKQLGTKNPEVEEYIQNKNQISLFLMSDIPKKLYSASFEFQRQLNEFLGQQVKMIFVVENSDGEPELYEMTSEDILKFDYSSTNKLTARYNVTSRDLGQSLKQLQITEANLHFSLAGLKTTYANVLERYRISRSKNLRLLMWKPGNAWKKMTVSAEGDINEAYAAFVFLNKSSPTFRRSLEYNIDDFAQGIANVDNMSGLLKGDVTVGNIEYGIKSAGASTLGLQQMQKIAKQILQEDFGPQSLQQIQKKMINAAKTRNKISNLIDSTADELIKLIDID